MFFVVDGGWTHWSLWETCDKPCGGGNRSRVRSCTHPPPTGGGADCEGPWNETLGCNTNPCPGMLTQQVSPKKPLVIDSRIYSLSIKSACFQQQLCFASILDYSLCAPKKIREVSITQEVPP